MPIIEFATQSHAQNIWSICGGYARHIVFVGYLLSCGHGIPGNNRHYKGKFANRYTSANIWGRVRWQIVISEFQRNSAVSSIFVCIISPHRLLVFHNTDFFSCLKNPTCYRLFCQYTQKFVDCNRTTNELRKDNRKQNPSWCT